MTQRPPPPIPRLEALRPRDERMAGAPPPGSYLPPQPRGRQLPPRQPRRGWFKIVAWSLVGVVGIGFCLGLLLTLFVPVGLVRDELVRAVKAGTGRDLVVSGRTSLSFFPALAVSMEDVSLSGPPGMVGPPLARTRRVTASAALLPLLSRQIAIDRIVLTNLVIDLQVDAQGRRNWDQAELPVMPPVRFAQAKTPGAMRDTLPTELEEFVRNSSQGQAEQGKGGKSASAGSGQASALRLTMADVSIGDISIENGVVKYRDARAGTSGEVTAIRARLALKSLTAPVESRGDFTFRGDKIDFNVQISSAKALIEQRSAKLVLALSSPRGSTSYEGMLNVGATPQLNGVLKVETASLRGLAAWLGTPLPAPAGRQNAGFGPLTLKGDVKTGPASFALAKAEIKLDDTPASGTVSVDLVGGRPQIAADLRLGALDLNRYLATEATAAAPSPPGSAPSIEDMIRKSVDDAAPRPNGPAPAPAGGAQVRGSVQRSGWSEDPIDLAALGVADTEAKISLAGLTYKEIKLGSTQVALALKGRALRVTIEEMKLYDGHGHGTLTLDASAATPTVGAVLNIDGVSGLPLLKDVAGFDWIAGRMKLDVAVGGQGGSERAIVESLGGKAELTVVNGALVGLDIPQIIKGIGQGKFAGLNRTPTDKTEFSEAGASYQIKAGVAESKDIRIVSPHVRVTGAGAVNLGQRQIDTTLRPKLAAPPAGQTGNQLDLSAVEIPIRIKGSWEKPQIGPDMDAVMRDPNKVIETVKEVAKQFKGKDVGEALRGLEKFFKR